MPYHDLLGVPPACGGYRSAIPRFLACFEDVGLINWKDGNLLAVAVAVVNLSGG